jgi:pimeloyl-ACP methyl ester carboxylesterase
MMLHSAYQGDYSLLGSQYLLVMSSLGGGLSTGMYYSVWCYEDMPKLAPEGELGSYYFDPDMSLSRDICSLWPKPGDAPRPTRTPTLLPTGDAATAQAPAGTATAYPAAASTGYPAESLQPTAAATDTYPLPNVQATPGLENPTAGATAGSSTEAALGAAGTPTAGTPSAAGTPDIDWERSFPRTDIPVMIISGEADPVTPPRNGDAVAALFTNSVHIVLPGMGHASFYVGCLPALLRDFIDAASPLALNLDCVRTIQPEPFWLSPVGPVN